jgi:hypothetical protein
VHVAKQLLAALL